MRSPKRSVSRKNAKSRGGETRRIYILSPTFLPIFGGAEVGIHELASRIAKTHAVTVLAPKSVTQAASGTEIEGFRSLHRPYTLISYRNWFTSLPKGSVRSALVALCLPELIVLMKLGAFRRNSTINVHFARPFGLVLAFARLVPDVRGVLSLVARSDVLATTFGLARLQLLLAIRVADSVVANSEYYLGSSNAAAKAIVIPYGVDSKRPVRSSDRAAIRRGYSVADSDVLLIAVQRLSKLKCVDVLIDVARKLKSVPTSTGGGYKLLVVGTGPELDPLRSQSRGDGNVIFAGYVDNEKVAQLYSAADIFVSHSVSETFGVTFVEAMAAGLPIVAVEASCVPLVVKDGLSGRLVQPYDVQSFADAVVELSDVDRRRSVSDANLRLASEKYDWNMIASEFALVLDGLDGRAVAD